MSHPIRVAPTAAFTRAVSVPGSTRRVKAGTEENPGATDIVISRFMASSDVIDRYEDIIDQRGWKMDNYLANPVVLRDHDYRVCALVGRMVKHEIGAFTRKDGTSGMGLFTDLQWDMGREEGAEVAGLVEREMLHAVSVGFRVLSGRWRDSFEKADPRYAAGSGYYIETAELYEISAVVVPGNQEALKVKGGASLDITAAVDKALHDALGGLSDEQWRAMAAARLTRSQPAPAAPAFVPPWEAFGKIEG